MQVARNLGKTLREFQPTIRELQVDIHKKLMILNISFMPLLRRPFILSFALQFIFRKFLRNSRAPLKRRLVWMTFQVLQ